MVDICDLLQMLHHYAVKKTLDNFFTLQYERGRQTRMIYAQMLEEKRIAEERSWEEEKRKEEEQLREFEQQKKELEKLEREKKELEASAMRQRVRIGLLIKFVDWCGLFVALRQLKISIY